MKISKILLSSLFSALVITSTQTEAQTKRTRKADDAFSNGEYHLAQEKYKSAYSNSSVKSEKQYISFRMAECARQLGNYRQAENYLKRTVKMRYEDPIAILYLAEAQANLGKYDLALENYEKYKKLVPGDKRAERGVENAKFGIDQMENPTLYSLTNMKRLNSRAMDYSPAFGKKDYSVLLFTTTNDNVIGGRLSEQTGQLFADIWGTELEKKKRKSSRGKKKDAKPKPPRWSRPVSLGQMGTGDGEETINTKHEEGTVSLTPKANLMYYSQGVSEKGLYEGQRLFVSKRKGGGWEEGTELEIPLEDIDKDNFVDLTHPAIHPDGRRLFFVAKLEGGYGGTDIWYTEFDKRKKKWTKPKNLGPNVNTRRNEGFPTVHIDGTLFFSSNGHNTLGGYDINRADLDEDGNYGNVANLGSPINSSYDDFGLIFKGNTYKEGYMTSNRKGGLGLDDIYKVVLLETEFSLDGKLVDETTGKPIKGLNVKLEGSDGSVVDVITDKDGNYSIDPKNISKGVDYNLVFTSEEYGSFAKKLTTKGLKVTDFERVDDHLEYAMSFDTTLVVQRLPIVLPHIEYDFGKATLRPEAEKDLDNLAAVLESNKTLRIKLRSHTDHIGGSDRNQELSQARAQACVDYLISKGIDASRMVAEGSGETIPFVMTTENGSLKVGDVLTEAFINKLSKKEQEIARQYNRRTDFQRLKPAPKESPEEKRAKEFGKY